MKKSLKRRLSVILASAVAVVGLTLGATIPASANSGYRGQDPQSTGCSSGSYTVQSWGLYNSKYKNYQGSVELRYSPRCGTNWIRVTSTVPGNWVYASVVTNYGASGANRQGSGISVARVGSDWSTMIEAPGSACVSVSATITDSRTNSVEGRLATQTVC